MKYFSLLVAMALVLIIVMPLYVSAVTIHMPDIEGSIFHEGDEVPLKASITNDANESIDVLYQEVLIMPKTPPMPMMDEMTIAPGETIYVSDLSFSVFRLTEPGSYTYSVSVMNDDMELTKKASVSFSIEGTLNTFGPVDVYFCADEPCNDVRSVFVLDDEEKAYVHVDSEDKPSISGELVYPDNTTSTIDMKEGKGIINFRGSGLYIARFTFTKDGYETKTKELKISVMGERPVIHYAYCSTKDDGVCDESCPEGEDPDCAKDIGGESKSASSGSIPNFWPESGQAGEQQSVMLLAIIAVILIIIIVGAIIFLKSKDKMNVAPTRKARKK